MFIWNDKELLLMALIPFLVGLDINLQPLDKWDNVFCLQKESAQRVYPVLNMPSYIIYFSSWMTDVLILTYITTAHHGQALLSRREAAVGGRSESESEGRAWGPRSAGGGQGVPGVVPAWRWGRHGDTRALAAALSVGHPGFQKLFSVPVWASQTLLERLRQTHASWQQRCEGYLRSHMNVNFMTNHVLEAGPLQWRGGLAACRLSLQSTCPSACADPESSTPRKAERIQRGRNVRKREKPAVREKVKDGNKNRI